MLRPGVNLVGRSLTNHIQVNDPSVSGSHCQIFLGEGLAQIKDLDSTNGTFVNGSAVQEAMLENGQTLRLGDVELQFISEEPPDVRLTSRNIPRL